ncbi:MAG TPA: FliH/SctL family protein, partial [Acidimicrobiales bacterium]|nr:FliH/SctL family protein [Acidimicrobiales bacterium]
MSSSSRVIARVLRGEAGRRAGAQVLDLHEGAQAPVAGAKELVDPFAAERALAYQAGYDAAVAEAGSSGQAVREARASALAQSLVGAAAVAHELRAAAMEQAAREAVELAFELTEALVGRELALDPSLTVDALKRALALVPQGEDLVVRLHPSGALTTDEVQDLVKDASVRVVADPDIEVGGCVVE